MTRIHGAAFAAGDDARPKAGDLGRHKRTYAQLGDNAARYFLLIFQEDEMARWHAAAMF